MRVRNLGVTSTIKHTLSLRNSSRKAVENAGSVFGNDDIYMDENGKLTLHIPLKMFMGFAEDFKRVMTRVGTDKNQ